jgi:hypothetical protein
MKSIQRMSLVSHTVTSGQTMQQVEEDNEKWANSLAKRYSLKAHVVLPQARTCSSLRERIITRE